MDQSAPAATQRSRDELRGAPELTIVVPMFNERDTIAPLVERLRVALTGRQWEVIFVDDNSSDGTAAAVRALGETDARVRCLRRIGRRGVTGACVEGMLGAQGRYVAVMEADRGHDARLLAAMLDRLRPGALDLVVASRDAGGRVWSRAAARRLTGLRLGDPMSGFFMIRRDRVDDLAPNLSSQGFKVLLDIAAAARGRLRFAELPAAPVEAAQREVDVRIAYDLAALVVARVTHDAVSVRFLLFCLVGLSGVGVHIGVLWGGLALTAHFGLAQTVATLAAMTWNYTLNNAITYRDQRLTGRQFFVGLLQFWIICAVAAVSNVGVASWIYYGSHGVWWVAGLCGAVMAAVWNYAVSAIFIWRAR